MLISKKQNQGSLGSSFWEKQVKSYQDSGLSQGEYCRRKRLKLSAFGYWYRKLHHQASEKVFQEKDKACCKEGFIEISSMVRNQKQNLIMGNATLEMEFQNGWKLKIPATWEHESLRLLLLLLKEEVCL